MKKFLRRTLGALALIGTSFGAKASNADEKQHENVIQNVNIDSKVNKEKNNDLNEQDTQTNINGLLFSLPTQKKIIETRRINSLLKNMVKEAVNSVKNGCLVPFANNTPGVELTLPSEKKTYKYKLSGLPSNYKQAELKVYEKLVTYILEARIEKLNKLNSNNNLSSAERKKNKAKLYFYKKVNKEDIHDYLEKQLNSENSKSEIKWLKRRKNGSGLSGKEYLRALGLEFRSSSYRSSRDFN